MSKHTPGPWHITCRDERPYAVDADSAAVVLWGGIARRASIEGKANARLIAAAPDLLEALGWFVTFHSGHVLPPELSRAMSSARAAIARAEGRGDQRQDTKEGT